ncbi:MAG TPA: hypothetical protein VGP33_18940, partial [Chloroflexota bacterium]|nr:hypothetical protein [Chloroflexota bacterium]
MSVRRILALTQRIVRQVVHDRRTLAFIFIVPLFVMTILNFVLNSGSTGLTLGLTPPDAANGQAVIAAVRQAVSAQPG